MLTFNSWNLQVYCSTVLNVFDKYYDHRCSIFANWCKNKKLADGVWSHCQKVRVTRKSLKKLTTKMWEHALIYCTVEKNGWYFQLEWVREHSMWLTTSLSWELCRYSSFKHHPITLISWVYCFHREDMEENL